MLLIKSSWGCYEQVQENNKSAHTVATIITVKTTKSAKTLKEIYKVHIFGTEGIYNKTYSKGGTEIKITSVTRGNISP